MSKSRILFISLLIIQFISAPSLLQASNNPSKESSENTDDPFRKASYYNPAAWGRWFFATGEYTPKNLKRYNIKKNNIKINFSDTHDNYMKNHFEKKVKIQEKEIKNHLNTIKNHLGTIKNHLGTITSNNVTIKAYKDNEKELLDVLETKNVIIKNKNQIIKTSNTWKTFFSQHYGKILIVSGTIVTAGLLSLVIYKITRKKGNNKSILVKKTIIPLSKRLKNSYNNMNMSCRNIDEILMFHLNTEKNNLIFEHEKIKEKIGVKKIIATDTISIIERSYKDFNLHLEQARIIGYQDKTNISHMVEVQICFLRGDDKKKKGMISKAINIILPFANEKMKEKTKKITKGFKRAFQKNKKDTNREIKTESLLVTHKEINRLIKSVAKYNVLIEVPLIKLKAKIETLVEEKDSQKIMVCNPETWKKEVSEYHKDFSGAVKNCGLPEIIGKQISAFDAPFKKGTDSRSIKEENKYYKKTTKQKSKTKKLFQSGAKNLGKFTKTIVTGSAKELAKEYYGRSSNEEIAVIVE
ncbi:hypothetical protein KAH94_01190 [bacterium]|nr:hypothetical protein [bacterium]